MSNQNFILKFFLIFLLDLFSPRYFLYAPIQKQPINCKIIDDKEFKLGLENISNKLLKSWISNKLKIGLITNQTGIDQNGTRNVDNLLSKGLNIKAIFAPEHGFAGQEEAGKAIDHAIDKKTKIPIISLYDGDSKFKKFNKSDLKNIDAFIFDIQDSGIRHYTYISILYKIMEIAGQFSKKVIILDRPNPLGIIMEGPLVKQHLISFVSIAPIPLRHALTIGELAKVFNKFELKKPVKLIIVPMKNYKRFRGLKDCLPTYLSPNIKNLNACLNYSFLGLLGEIYPFNVLVGTSDAFLCLMLPDTINFPVDNWNELSNLLKKQNITSSIFKYFNKDKNQNFTGLKIKINDINKFSNLNTILIILKFFKNKGINFSFSKPFNKLIGTEKFENFIKDGFRNKQFIKEINNDLKKFYEKIKNLLIYDPPPKIEEIRF